MSNLQAFLEDTKIALDNGFGKTESILRMFNALHVVMELHKPHNEHPRQCSGCEVGDPWYWNNYPCPTIQAIERELG